MLNEGERDILKKTFTRMYALIGEEIGNQDRYSVAYFAELCSAINNCYKTAHLSPSHFVELLELYIEFFKEKTGD